MWAGSSGPYRSQQPAETAAQQSHWSTGGGLPPSSPLTGMPDNQRENGLPSSSGASRSIPYHETAQNGVGADGIPEPPKTFPELEALSLRDLRLLRDENAKFEDFVSKHKHQLMVEKLVAGVRANVDASEREHIEITANMGNIGDEEELDQMRHRIKQMEDEVNGLQKLKDEWFEHNSPEKLMERLQIAMRESETVSAGLEKGMLSSSMNFDAFLAQYIACRKKYHERSLKLEQLKLEAKKKSFSR